jgi:hypothetical protein
MPYDDRDRLPGHLDPWGPEGIKVGDVIRFPVTGDYWHIRTIERDDKGQTTAMYFDRDWGDQGRDVQWIATTSGRLEYNA